MRLAKLEAHWDNLTDFRSDKNDSRKLNHSFQRMKNSKR